MPRLGDLFAPRDRAYFELFEEAGQNVVLAANLLETSLARAAGQYGLTCSSRCASARVKTSSRARMFVRRSIEASIPSVSNIWIRPLARSAT